MCHRIENKPKINSEWILIAQNIKTELVFLFQEMLEMLNKNKLDQKKVDLLFQRLEWLENQCEKHVSDLSLLDQ